MELYDGTLGPSIDFVDEHQTPVGQIQWENDLNTRYTNPGDVQGVRWCTCTMITSNLAITAGHCFDPISIQNSGWTLPMDASDNVLNEDQIAEEMQVNFNFQLDEDGASRQEVSFDIDALVEWELGGLDYALIRLRGNPGDDWGTTPLAAIEFEADQELTIIQHPNGMAKQVEGGHYDGISGDYVTYRNLDTLGGSSGSGVLDNS